MKKLSLRMLLLLLAAMMFVACGSADETPAADEPAADEPAADTQAEADPEPEPEPEEPAMDGLGGKDLIVAIENAYPPFSMIDESGEAVGYDYDIFREICSRLNCNPVFQETSWDAIVAIMGGDSDFAGFDIGADGITITEERAQHVDFTRPYISLSQTLLVRADETRFSDSAGFAADDALLIGSQPGTTNYDLSVDLVGEDRIVAYDQFALAVAALIQGDVDAVTIDNVAGVGYVGQNPDAVMLLDEPLTAEELGFILPKGSEMTAMVNETLDAMEADGTLQMLFDKWFITDEEEASDDMGAAVESEYDTNIVIWSDNNLTPILQELVIPFQEENGIGLIIQDVPDRNDQFPIAAPAGEGPDIIMLPHDRLGGFVESGLLAPVDLGDKADSFDPAALAAWTFDGQVVGVPYTVENMAFFYNTDMVDAAPATWAEAMEVGGAMVDSGDATYALALTGTTYDSFPIHTAFGGYVFGFNDDGSYNPEDVGIDGDGMVAAGEFIAENVAAGYISDNTDWDTAHLQFETGEVPYLMAGPWALDRLRSSGIPYEIAAFPTGTEQGTPFLGVWGFAVNSLGDNVLLAQTFLTEYLATDEAMQVLVDGSNRPSAWNGVTSTDPDTAKFGVAAVGANAMPAIPEMGSVWGSWGDAFALIISGEQSAADALGNGAAQIRDLIGGAASGMVNVPGSWQEAVCEGAWDPACEASALTDNGDGTYSGTFPVMAGDWEVKVALDGAWTENYGVDGAADGDNITFSAAADGMVTFTWDSESKILTVEVAEGEGSMDGAMMAECTEDLTGEEIVLYQQAGREGPLAAILGDGFALATADSIEYINANGGVCGATLVVDFCETNYNPELEVSCYEESSASDPKPIILFSYGSGATIALKDRVVEDEIVHMVAGLNSEALYNPADGYTFASFPIYGDQFAGFMQYVADNWADIKPEGAGDDIVVGVVGWANAFGAGATTPEAIAYIESLGITVLPLEEQAISPDADVTAQIQNLLLGGANVIYNQNLSFGTTQVIGTLRALGVWDSLVVGGVNWTFNTDVVGFLGENAAAANGYYGVFPNLWYTDTDNEIVALANAAAEANGYGPADRNTSYLTTWASMMLAADLLEAAIIADGYENLSGASVKAALDAAGVMDNGVISLDARDGSRATHQARIGQMQFDGSAIQFVPVTDWIEMPDLRPAQ